MDELVEAVLAVRARLAPEDRARLVVHRRTVGGDRLSVRLHRQLLEIRGEALQVLVVGEHRDRLRAEEVRVPDRQQAEQDGQVALERHRAKVLVDRMEAGQHPAEALGPDRDHRREADRGVHRVAAADPVPEAEHVRRVDAELGYLVRVRRHRDEVFRHRRFVSELRKRPLARGRRVPDRLQRRERLRRDDEQRLLRIEVARRLDDVGAVDVGDEAERQVALRVVAEGLVRHDRAEVRAADADVDHVADPLAGVSRPLPAADAVGERRHAVEDLVHLRDDVLAVHLDVRPLRRAERDMQHGAVLRDVDVLAGEHRVAPLGNSALLGELEQEPERLVGDPVLRVVEVDALGLGRQALPARGVSFEEVAKMGASHFLGVLRKGAPRCRLAELRRGRRCHVRGPPQRVAVGVPAFRPMFSRGSSHYLANASAPLAV